MNGSSVRACVFACVLFMCGVREWGGLCCDRGQGIKCQAHGGKTNFSNMATSPLPSRGPQGGDKST